MNSLVKMPGIRANITPYAALLHKSGPALKGYGFHLMSWGGGNKSARRVAPLCMVGSQGMFRPPCSLTANRQLIPAIRREYNKL